MSDITMLRDYLVWLGASADDAFDDLTAALDITKFEFSPDQEDSRMFTQETSLTGGLITYGVKTYSGKISMIRREGEVANEAQWQLLDTTAKTDGARLTAAFVRGAIGTSADADAAVDGWIGELALKECPRSGDAGSAEAHVYEWEFTLESAYVIATNTTDPRPSGS